MANSFDDTWCDHRSELTRATVGWAVFGYVTLLLSMVSGLLLLAFGVIVAVHFQSVAGTILSASVAFAGISLATFVASCLWVRFGPPQGLALTESEHPELHLLIQKIGDRAGGVRFRQVILDSEMNASAIQNPRLGVLGWYRAYLVIGLPLMETLPVDEFKAVIAHEIAHLSRADGKTGAWLHRTRSTWERIANRSVSRAFIPMLRCFFNWFWPRFNSKSLILSRHNELEADRFAARWTSPAAVSSGLKRLAIQSHRAEAEFWQPLDRVVESQAELPDDVMARFSEFLRTPTDPNRAQFWLVEALSMATGPLDSHPNLTTRLSHLDQAAGVARQLPEALPPGSSAADCLLSPACLQRARREFSARWLTESLELRASRSLATPDPGYVSTHKTWDRITTLARLDGLEKVQAELLSLLARKPSHSGALYLRGCYLAQKNDPEASDFLERAAMDPTLAGRAFEALAGVHSLNSRYDLLAQLKERSERHEMELRAALVERNQVSPADTFLPHEIAESDLMKLHKIFASETAIHRAWLGAKYVRHFNQWRHLILVVEMRGSIFQELPEEVRHQIESRLLDAWDCEDYLTILPNTEANRPILKAMRRGIADCEVYRRK